MSGHQVVRIAVLCAVTNQLCGMFGIVVGMTGSVQRSWLTSGSPARESFSDPFEIKFPISSCTVSKVEIDECLIRNAGLVGNAFEVFDDIHA